MADFFISYKREDVALVRSLATAIEQSGLGVAWWDQELQAGERFDDVIQQQIDAARCVIVLWTLRSVESNFVKDEATYALDRNKLFAISVAGTPPPLRFRRIHTIAASDWSSDPGGTSTDMLTRELGRWMESRNTDRSPKPPDMITICGGEAILGSPADWPFFRIDEPEHLVSLSLFHIARSPVSVEEYLRYADSTERALPPGNERHKTGWPVIVSLEDAMEYIKWLSQATGIPYRLPSDDEWEFAVRAGTRSPFWWGEAIGDEPIQACGRSDPSALSPIGTYGENPWGLIDTLGNVWEWTSTQFVTASRLRFIKKYGTTSQGAIPPAVTRNPAELLFQNAENELNRQAYGNSVRGGDPRRAPFVWGDTDFYGLKQRNRFRGSIEQLKDLIESLVAPPEFVTRPVSVDASLPWCSPVSFRGPCSSLAGFRLALSSI